jgi:hypothetical protein
MKIKYELSLLGKNGTVLRNFGGSFPVDGGKEYRRMVDLISYLSHTSEQKSVNDSVENGGEKFSP